LDSNSLTKTKNWSGRNEVTETSGRLHTLWPQNKWLHTPRNTDYRHTRQDRLIHTELLSTLPKNVTKPNPFEIISLQTIRKENNWKTEEALARAAVTLETVRIKGSNPWCLWWWCLRTAMPNNICRYKQTRKFIKLRRKRKLKLISYYSSAIFDIILVVRIRIVDRISQTQQFLLHKILV